MLRCGPGGIRCTLAGLGLAALLALPTRGVADAAATPPVAVLKGVALDLLQAQPAPAAGGLELYIGNTDDALLLRQLTVWIDDAPPLRYDYSDREALALHRGGLHRFPLPALAPGAHHLRADFAARYADAPPDYWRAAGSVECKLTLDTAPQLLELELVKGSYIGKPELQVHELKPAEAGPMSADGFVRGSAADPRLREAAYLTGSDRPMDAALALLRLQKQGAAMPADFQLRLAQALQAYGVDDRARTLYLQAAGASDARLQSEAHLGLAELQLGSGELAAAQQNAEAVAPGLPKELQIQAQDLQARIAIAGGDQARALALVGQADSAPLIYSRYNLGVSLLKGAQAAQGRALLEGIASGSGNDAEAAVLRDKVNVALGYEQLRQRTGSAAIPLFSRVRSPSLYTGAALLGLGWALLAPSGNSRAAAEEDMDFEARRTAHPQAPYARIPVLLQPALTDDVASWRRAQPFKLNPPSPQEEQALRRALVPWVELIGRDPLDPAVQEGAIAIPYALLHIGADDEAQEYFQRAIRLLEAADAQFDAAQQRVRGGALAQAFERSGAQDDGWPWWLAVFPREHWWLADDPHQPLAAPDLFYLEHLMEDGRFRQVMQDYHDLWALDGALAGADGTAALRARIAAAQAALAAGLQDLALAGLQREQRQARMYLGEARFALAHLNEPPAGAPP